MDKVLSIAPSFDCALKCEGCYLTTNVSKEMRVATKNNSYWELIFTNAAQNGYNQLYMTMNPMPAKTKVVLNTLRLAEMALDKGFEEVHVTTSYRESWPDQTEIDAYLYDKRWVEAVTTTTFSIDDLRGNIRSTLIAMKKEMERWETTISDSEIGIGFNLLWTPTMLTDESFLTALSTLLGNHSGHKFAKYAIQHLYYKPVSLYPNGQEWLLDTLGRLHYEYPNIGFLGGKENIMCDPALLNTYFDGLAVCPGHAYRMIDIDPMGFARRCPENEVTYDARYLADAFQYLENGLPDCDNEDCNCFQQQLNYMMPGEI